MQEENSKYSCRIDLDKYIRESFPTELASAWVRLELADDSRLKTEQIRSFFEILGRYLLSLQLAEFKACAEADQQLPDLVWAVLEPGKGPTLGLRWDAVQAMAKLAEDYKKSEKNGRKFDRFIQELPDWIADKRVQIARGELVEERNLSVHGTPPGPKGRNKQADDQRARLTLVLDSLEWLPDYRVVCFPNTGTRKGKLVTIKAQIFCSTAAQGISANLQHPKGWDYDTSTAYFAHPKRGLLLAQPFLLYDNETLYLGESVDKSGHLHSKCDSSLSSLQTSSAEFLQPKTIREYIESQPEDDLWCWQKPLAGELGKPAVRPPPSHLPPGYREWEEIAQGGFAVIYRGRNEIDNELSAIKVLAPGSDDTAYERLKVEGEMMEDLTHPNIVKGRKETSTHGKRVIRMPYIVGGTLEKRLRQKLPEKTITDWFSQIVSALAYLENEQILHRDLKPQNLLITKESTVKLCDFGLATNLANCQVLPEDRLTKENTWVGTQGYAAPEQHASGAVKGSDMYSAGVVLFQMLATPLKFKANEGPKTDLAALRNRVQTQRNQQKNASTYEQLLSIAEKCVLVDPGERISPQEALDELKGDSRNKRKTKRSDNPPQPTVSSLGLGFEAGLCEVQTPDSPSSGGSSPVSYEAKKAAIFLMFLMETYDMGSGDWARYNLKKVYPLLNPACSEIAKAAEKVTWHWERAKTVQELMDLLPDSWDQQKLLSEYQLAEGNVGLQLSDLLSAKARSIGFKRFVRSLGKPDSGPVSEKEFLQRLVKLSSELSEQFDSKLIQELNWEWLGIGLDYQRRYIKKANGKLRPLDVPRPWLKTVQRELVEVIGSAIPGHSAATGFLQQRSPALHARYHAGASQAVVVDIKDFFGSVFPRHVRSVLRLNDWKLTGEQRKPLGDARHWGRTVIGGELVPEDVLAGWERLPFTGWSEEGRLWVERILFRQDPVTHVRSLAQGAPSSPMIANLAAYPMDCWIENQLDRLMKEPCTYSRYADDLVISSRFPNADFQVKARDIIETALSRFGWKPHPNKTRLWDARSGRVLTLCGVTVPRYQNGALRMPKSIRRRVRSILHRSGWGASSSATRRELTQQEKGLLSYVWSITGDLRLAPLVSDRQKARLCEMATAFGVKDRDDFLAAWIQLPTPSWIGVLNEVLTLADSDVFGEMVDSTDPFVTVGSDGKLYEEDEDGEPVKVKLWSELVEVKLSE